ncbi:MAG: YceH family protein [Rhodocyclaceae bacterium]
MPITQLTPIQARVLGVLAEKEKTVPDAYPMSLNSLVTGCNQKTSRDPVMELSDADALTAIDELKNLHLVIESSGSRVTRYGHNIGRAMNLPTPATALIVTLMLRGPQTVAELRANSERLYRFADASSVEAFLEELSQRADFPLCKLLPRAPGAREARWAHLLCGEPEVAAVSSHSARADSSGLAERVTALEEEVARLAAIVARLAPDEAA